jgi:dihydroorotate dehydrogenase electron transfer subunit
MSQKFVNQLKRVLAEVVECENLAPAHPGHFRLIINSEFIASIARPGQFVHILPESAELMLRRPISIMSVDKSIHTVSVIFRVIGEGTNILSKLNAGDIVDTIGPLGNGFEIDPHSPAVIIGGGVGIPPLVFLAEKLKSSGFSTDPNQKKSMRVFLGARDQETLVCLKEFRALGIRPTITTEDASEGMPGFVTDALRAGHNYSGDIVYACGPLPMLRAVSKWADEWGLKCFISMENKLGCGFGACLGCSIPVRDGDNVHYERVCVEGPAFDSKRVAFDLM